MGQMTDGGGVVRIGSQVCIRDIGGSATFWIVEPENADATADRVSAQSPLGSALLGSRVGDRVRFRAPAGVLAVTVVDVEHARAEDARDRATIPHGLPATSEPSGSRSTRVGDEVEP